MPPLLQRKPKESEENVSEKIEKIEKPLLEKETETSHPNPISVHSEEKLQAESPSEVVEEEKPQAQEEIISKN